MFNPKFNIGEEVYFVNVSYSELESNHEYTEDDIGICISKGKIITSYTSNMHSNKIIFYKIENVSYSIQEYNITNTYEEAITLITQKINKILAEFKILNKK